MVNDHELLVYVYKSTNIINYLSKHKGKNIFENIDDFIQQFINAIMFFFTPS